MSGDHCREFDEAVSEQIMNRELMTLEQEKKLVAEKLMGWELPGGIYGDGMYRSPQMKKVGTLRSIDLWNPHKDRNCWPEIWEKICVKRLDSKYLDAIENQTTTGGERLLYWYFHTVSSEICCKALIKTLS